MKTLAGRIEKLIDLAGELAATIALAIICLMAINVVLRYSLSLGAM